MSKWNKVGYRGSFTFEEQISREVDSKKRTPLAYRKH